MDNKVNNLAQIVVGTGVGVGVIINGKIHRPKHFHQEGGHIFANALCLHDKLRKFVSEDLKDQNITLINRNNIIKYAMEFNSIDAGLE